MPVSLSRSCHRHLRLGWMATMATTMPNGSVRCASTDRHVTSPLQAIKTLTKQWKEPELLRAPRTLQGDDVGSTSRPRTEEKRRRTELATEVCSNYIHLPPLQLPPTNNCERWEFIQYLATDCAPSHRELNMLLQEISSKQRQDTAISPTFLSSKMLPLRKSCTPIYEEILEFILQQDAVEGMRFLVALRGDLLRLLQWMRLSSNHEDDMLPSFKNLDAYLLRLFSIWFSPGMLELRRITYEETSAAVIEFIATKEAVHPMQSLDDLRRRLGPGRRVLALFHPIVMQEPLVFVHVALSNEIPSSMNTVMTTKRREDTTCATFYSITNAQPALAGIGLGQSLLKQSISMLQDEFSSLTTFVTLSPMPRFRKWLEEKIRQNMDHGHFEDTSLVCEEDWTLLKAVGLVSESQDLWGELLLALENADFSEEGPRTNALESILQKLAARYLILEKHRGKPLDGVAHFHLSNGALVHRINFAADLSRKGLQNSFGMMVNYRREQTLSK